MKLPPMRKAETPLHYYDEESYCRIGLIVLATDLTSEYDFSTICKDPSIRLHTTRVEYSNPVTPHNLRALKKNLSLSATLLPPEVPLKAVYFSCTSAGALLGDATVREKIQAATGAIPVITPLAAASSAFDALGTRKLSILTPYTEDVAKPVGEYFQNKGFVLHNISCMGLTDDREMARITAESIINAARDTTAEDADALFISCTALCSAQIAGIIEEKIGKPVVTSNQAAAWKTLNIAGISAKDSGRGKLFTLSAR